MERLDRIAENKVRSLLQISLTDRITTIASLSDTELSLETALVHDSLLGDIVPHSQWKRAN